jgi:DNA-binding transcriptional LysR family regulator
MEWSERIGRRLKLRDLHVLLAVVQHGSIAQAAQHLGISHPVVSKAIADLEHTLGVRLFDRSPRGVEPTLYGRAFLASSRAVFDELQQGVRNIEFLTDPGSGELRIGSTEPMAAGLTMAVLDRLAAQYPRVLFHVTEADAATLARELRERNIELSVGRFPRPMRTDDLEVKLDFGERQHVVAGVENRWVGRRKIRLDELVEESWILPPLEGMAGSQIREAFLASGIEIPRPRLITYSIPLRIGLLATGRFLTIFPSSLLTFSTMGALFRTLSVELPTDARPAGIVALKGRTLSPLAEIFIACAREIATGIGTTADAPCARVSTAGRRGN